MTKSTDMITDETIVSIHEGEGWPEIARCTWGEFKDENDGMDQDDFQEIRDALNSTGVFHGGGGAMSEYQLRRG